MTNETMLGFCYPHCKQHKLLTPNPTSETSNGGCPQDNTNI